MANEWDWKKELMILALVILAVLSFYGIRNIVEMFREPDRSATVTTEGRPGSPNADSHRAQTSRFDLVLNDLATSCQETRSQLRRMIMWAVETKRSEGVSTDSLDVAEGLRTAIRGIRPGECVDELSALMVLMDYQ